MFTPNMTPRGSLQLSYLIVGHKLSNKVLYDHYLFLTIVAIDPRFNHQGVVFVPENISIRFLVKNRPNVPNFIKISPACRFSLPGGHVQSINIGKTIRN
jgi:hypothetical protein